jgi:hypothetical protein
MDSSFKFEIERQQLVKEAHSLIVLIANKPNCLKLLKITIDSLKLYAGYKSSGRGHFGG